MNTCPKCSSGQIGGPYPTMATDHEMRMEALRLFEENEKLVGWLRRHARYVPGRTDETEWKAISRFLDEHVKQKDAALA